MIDHDRNFKELLSNFFIEFIALLLPDVAAYIDPTAIEFLDKEIFTDIAAGEKHEVDLVTQSKSGEVEINWRLHRNVSATDCRGDEAIRA